MSLKDDFPRWLFSQNCEFVAGATIPEQLPELTLPEVAFAGRSNVGKSSLINSLTSRKALARTSSTPGRTQQVNFFQLGKHAFLVDLPGYGYAAASKREIRRWNDLIYSYLKGRVQLRRTYLLIDSRHGLKTIDREIMKDLDVSAVSYQIVLTKVDKITAADLHALKENLVVELKKHPAAHPEIIATSSVNKDGVYDLQNAICEFVDAK